ncbi:MAG TPA: bifunctional enoyl-CoA hydratase/phosphate acetyltransferase [Bacillota bacterium]|nr:bifunctional enoyl-CoA hydratase/phosphate acetyltransferase [Bacillota bacterium]HNY67403.1 bifunctional enoyl-CoA hydratase/phosphate acetyltransferase [Bacillota bacterium]
MLTSFDQVLTRARAHASARVAVCAAQDREVLEAVRMAAEIGMGEFTLVGDARRIAEVAADVGLDLSGVVVVDEPDAPKAARLAVSLVSAGEAGILMKGLVPTADFLRAVLDREVGLRTGKLLSHVAVFRSSRYDRFFYLTDGAMVVAPTLEEKVQIIENAVGVAHKLGNETPKVACVAAVEVVNPAMPETIEAAALAKMSDRRQIRGCIIDGPLGLDNAVSMDSAQHKGVGGPVAGQADIILAPDIAAGNAIYKTMIYFGDIESAAVVAGARAPIVLTSRSDSPRARLLSLAVAIVTSK